jgi:VWFA-related protein
LAARLWTLAKYVRGRESEVLKINAAALLPSSLILVAAAFAVAQEPIRVTTRLIEVNVIARNHLGPVGDLKQSDFKVFDNGKEQPIAIFRVSRTTPPNAGQTPLPPGVFSNRYGPAANRTGAATVLLIDTLNTDTADQVYAQKQIIKLFDSFDIQTPIALYVLTGKLVVLQDFTMDLESLRRAMAAWRPVQSRVLFASQTPTPRMPGGDPVTAEAIKRSYREMRASYNLQRANLTVDAFELLARRLMPWPGRKNVVWVSGSFPSIFLNGNQERLRILNQADIGIYPVDPRGMTWTNPRDPWPTNLVGPPPNQGTLSEIAERTGGRAFYNTNDLKGAVGKAIADTQIIYTLGFYAQNEKVNGLYHELNVKVDRSGTELRHRRGYYDDASVSEVPSSPAILRRLADAPLDATAIGLTATMDRDQDLLRVNVQIDFRDLALSKQDGHWKGAAELALVSQGINGRTLDLVSKSITFDMTDDVYAARQRDGFAIEQHIRYRKDLSRIRVVIVDASTGAAGSVAVKPLKQ